MDFLYHYTKLKSPNYDILTSIVREDSIVLRATYFEKFNLDDYLWVKEYSKEIIKDICKEKNWKFDPDMLSVKAFIVSFCTNGNSAYMWNHYSDNQQGIKLIINKELLLSINHIYGFDENGNSHDINYLESLLPCTYIEKQKDLKSKLLEVINDQNRISSYIDMDESDRLQLITASIKKKDPFNKEEEYRYICLYPIVFEFNETNIVNEDPSPEYNYLYLYNPHNLLEGIELGKNTTPQDMEFIENWLSQCGYQINEKVGKTIWVKT